MMSNDPVEGLYDWSYQSKLYHDLVEIVSPELKNGNLTDDEINKLARRLIISKNRDGSLTITNKVFTRGQQKKSPDREIVSMIKHACQELKRNKTKNRDKDLKVNAHKIEKSKVTVDIGSKTNEFFNNLVSQFLNIFR